MFVVVLDNRVEETGGKIRQINGAIVKTCALYILVSRRFEYKVGREELKEGEITSLKRYGAGIKPDGDIDRLKP